SAGRYRPGWRTAPAAPATPDGVRSRLYESGQPLVELTGRDPLLPVRQGGTQGRRQLLHTPGGLGRHVDPDGPRDAAQFPLDLLVQVVPAVDVDQVPLVEGEDERPAGLGDHGQDPLVLFADRF